MNDDLLGDSGAGDDFNNLNVAKELDDDGAKRMNILDDLKAEDTKEGSEDKAMTGDMPGQQQPRPAIRIKDSRGKEASETLSAGRLTQCLFTDSFPRIFFSNSLSAKQAPAAGGSTPDVYSGRASGLGIPPCRDQACQVQRGHERRLQHQRIVSIVCT